MLALALAFMLQGPTLDVCRRFTPAEVATVLGAPPTKPGAAKLRSTCSWGVPGTVLTISAVDIQDPAAAAAMVGAAKSTARKGDVVKDEPGGAVSMIAANGRTAEYLYAAGPYLWRLVVESGDKAIRVDTTLAALRKL